MIAFESMLANTESFAHEIRDELVAAAGEARRGRAAEGLAGADGRGTSK